MEKRINKHLYTWVGAFIFGGLGINRFMRGQVGLGILKLVAWGIAAFMPAGNQISLWIVKLAIIIGIGIWSLIDWIIALTKLGKYENEFVFIDKKWSK
jgi:TM2 domain-containing membrane protein YozV